MKLMTCTSPHPLMPTLGQKHVIRLLLMYSQRSTPGLWSPLPSPTHIPTLPPPKPPLSPCLENRADTHILRNTYIWTLLHMEPLKHADPQHFPHSQVDTSLSLSFRLPSQLESILLVPLP